MNDPQPAKGQSVPAWYGALHASDRQALAQRWCERWPDRALDVVVVGAGIAGLSTAYHLLKQGCRVAVLEMNGIGSGETGRTSAHLASAVDDRYHELERIHGAAHAALIAQSHQAAISSIEAICTNEEISCEFERVNGYLLAANRADEKELARELGPAQRAGLSVTWQDAGPLPFHGAAALRFADQAQFQPLAYLLGLARAVQRLGGLIYTHTKMRAIEQTHGLRVHVTGQVPLDAGAVVVATNTPVNARLAMHTKQAPYRSYVLGIDVPAGSIERALYWDTLDPYHYCRLVGDELLLVGGEDHKVGQSREPSASWSRLEAWVRERFSGAGDVRFRWSGQIQEPDDGVAFIGKAPGQSAVYMATGDSGNGMTHGALAGMLLSDLIVHRDNAWARAYDPARKITHPSAARDFVRENLNVALHYGDWLKSYGGRREIARGEGRVIRDGLLPVAVYVDSSGREHRRSAICPHLGCIVAWNSAEHSWDCPCHGSRFDAHGTCLIGPSNDDLKPLEK